jgi:hypothetical protein
VWIGLALDELDLLTECWKSTSRNEHDRRGCENMEANASHDQSFVVRRPPSRSKVTVHTPNTRENKAHFASLVKKRA